MKSSKSLLIITLGETPRTDIIDELSVLKENNFQVHQVGLMDNVSIKRRYNVSPDDEQFYVTKLKNGEQIKMNSKAVEKELEKIIEAQSKNTLILVLCTGSFSRIKESKSIFIPERILFEKISDDEICDIGVVVPDEKQVESIRYKWENHGFKVKVIPYSPYEKQIIDKEKITKEFQGIKYVIFDCMGYRKNMEIVQYLQSFFRVIISRDIVFEEILNSQVNKSK